jgi:hypothetical protein
MEPRFLPTFENCVVSPNIYREGEYDEDNFISDVLAFELGSFTDVEWFCFRDGLRFALKNEINEKTIKQINSFVRGGAMDGKYREINVRSSGFHHKYTNPAIIPYKMKDLIEKMRVDLFGVATFFYYFLHIHPFPDGNGRTAHIICAILLGKFVPLCFSSRSYLVRNMEKGLNYVFGYVLLCVSRFKPVHFT